MTATLTGKVTLIIGASQGIGRATALAFSRAGAPLMLAGRRASELKLLAQEIRSLGAIAAYQPADVTDAQQVEQLVAATLETYGRLDCAFNNAGTTRRGSLSTLTAEDWDQVLAVNLKGIWLSLKYEIPAMLATGGGAIVNMASVAGLVGTADNSIYAASKGGVIALSRAVAIEYAASNIRVNAISPGAIETALFHNLPPTYRAHLLSRHPVGRLGTVEEVAHAVTWLCSDEASFMTGHNLVLDGGVTAQ